MFRGLKMVLSLGALCLLGCQAPSPVTIPPPAPPPESAPIRAFTVDPSLKKGRILEDQALLEALRSYQVFAAEFGRYARQGAREVLGRSFLALLEDQGGRAQMLESVGYRDLDFQQLAAEMLYLQARILADLGREGMAEESLRFFDRAFVGPGVPQVTIAHRECGPLEAYRASRWLRLAWKAETSVDHCGTVGALDASPSPTSSLEARR